MDKEIMKYSYDLASLMDKQLRSEAADNSTKAKLIEGALEDLSKAAEIFDSLQDKQASEAITVLLEKMAGK